MSDDWLGTSDAQEETPRNDRALGAAVSTDVEQAVADIATGRAVVVVGYSNRDNDGALVFAAEKATAKLMAFMVRYTSGLIFAPMTEENADRLDLPPMFYTNEQPAGPAYTVTVDSRHGGTTGISSTDRAHTARVLADPETRADELTRPGHMAPLRAKQGGTLTRTGYAEAAVDLAQLAGSHPVAVISGLVSESGDLATRSALHVFADKHDLTLITIGDLARYRQRREMRVTRIAEERLLIDKIVLRAVSYRSLVDERTHLALVHGEISDGKGVLTRTHLECLAGDVFSTPTCDCRRTLDESLRDIAREKAGVLLYIRHADRGEGPLTHPHNSENGRPRIDPRDYGTCSHMLRDLDVRTIRHDGRVSPELGLCLAAAEELPETTSAAIRT